MYIYTHIFIYMYIYTHTHIYVYVYINTHTYKHIRIYMYMCVYIYAYIYTYIHIYIHTHIYVCVYIYMNQFCHHTSGIHTVVYWVMTSSSLVGNCQRFRGTYWSYSCLHCGSSFLWNSADNLQGCTELQQPDNHSKSLNCNEKLKSFATLLLTSHHNCIFSWRHRPIDYGPADSGGKVGE
jgi:hypothetical protein